MKAFIDDGSLTTCGILLHSLMMHELKKFCLTVVQHFGLHIIHERTMLCVCVGVVATQPFAFTPATVKRRKRRVPAVQDTTEPDVHPMSSDDYAASSADISSSSSSNEDIIIASCEQHVIRKEVPLDHGTTSVFWIPSSLPLSDGLVTTTDSMDLPTNSYPVLPGVQKLHLGQCDGDHALVIQDSHTLANDLDLTVGSNAFVEAVSLGVESSQEVQEQSIQSEGLSSVSFSDRYRVDGCVDYVSDEAGDDYVKVPEQPGIESLVAVKVESDEFDDVVVCAKSQEVVKEDLMLISDHKLQEAEPSNESTFWHESCQTDDDDDDVSIPRSGTFEPLTTGGKTASLSLSRLNMQLLRDIENVKDISVPDEVQIVCGSVQRRTVSLPRLTLVSPEASPHVQHTLESASLESQNHCGEVDPLRTDSVSVNYPHWSSNEDICVSVNGGHAALPVTETTVSESFLSTDVIGLLSGDTDSVCLIHTGASEHHSETYESDFMGQHQEQQRKRDATAQLQDDAEQLTLPGVTSLNYVADAVGVNDSISGLYPELDRQEEIIGSCQSDNELKQETCTDRHHLDKLSDITNRDLLYHQGGDKVQSSIVLVDEKLSQDNLQVSSGTTNTGSHYCSTLMENLTGSGEKESSANPAQWSKPEDKEDRCSGVGDINVVSEAGSDGVTVSVEQLQQLADAGGVSLSDEGTSIDVNESENETHLVVEVLSHKPEMLAELGDKSFMTAHEEVSLLMASTNVHEMPGSTLPNAPTEVLTSLAQMGRLAQMGQDLQQLAITAFVGVAESPRTPGSSAIEVMSDTVHATDGNMPESGTNEADQTPTVRSIDHINHIAGDLHQMSVFHNRAGLHDAHAREIDDWIDADTGPSEDMVVAMHSGAIVEVGGVDEQAFPINSDKACHVEAGIANGNVKSQLQFRCENVVLQSVTEEKDAREETTSSKTPSARWGVSSNDSCSNISDVESNDTGVIGMENKDSQHLVAVETADRPVSVMETAVVEMQSGTSADNCELSFDDGMSSESLKLNVHVLLDQLSPGDTSSRETVLEAREGYDKSEADKGEVDNTEPRKPLDVTGSTGGNFMEQSDSILMELVDSSLQVSAVNHYDMTDAHEFEDQLFENDESYNMSPTSEAAEQNHRCDSGTVLPFENSIQNENSRSSIHPLGMTEDGREVNVSEKASCSYLVSSVNSVYGADSEPCTHLNVNLHEYADEHNVNVADSDLEQTKEPYVDVDMDSCESAEPSEDLGHNKEQVFSADGLYVSVCHTPDGSSVSSGHLCGVPYGSDDHGTREPLTDSLLTILPLEPEASGFDSEMMTKLSDSDALCNKSRNAVELDFVNTELGNPAAGVNVESQNETAALCGVPDEQKAATAISTCDSPAVLSSDGIDTVLDRPAMLLFENSDDDVHRDIAEVERGISNSGELNACSCAVGVADSSLADENVVPVFDHCASFGLNLVCHDQSNEPVVKPEENREEIGPDTNMNVVVGGCALPESVQVLTNELPYDSPITSVISEANSDHNSPEADDSVESEISVGTQSSRDLSTAVVTDSHNVVEPLNALADIMLKAEISDYEQHEFSSKQESADSVTVLEGDVMREVIVALQNECTVFETSDDSMQKEIVQHTEFLFGKPDVPFSSIVNQSELYAIKDIASTELVSADAVRNRPVFAMSTHISDTPADISCVTFSNFGTQLDQQLNVTETCVSCLTTETSLELVTNKPAVHEEHDQLLDYGVVAVQKDSDSVDDEQTGSDALESGVLMDTTVASGRDESQYSPIADAKLSLSSLTAVDQFDYDDLHAHLLAEQVSIWQNDSLLRIIPEPSMQRTIVDHQEDWVKPDPQSQHEEAAPQCQYAGLCEGGTVDGMLRFSQLHAIAVDGDSEVSTVLFSNDDEGISSSAFTENLDKERLMMPDLDTTAENQMNQQASGITESCQCALGSVEVQEYHVEVQEDHLTHGVDAPLVSTVDEAVLLQDSDFSVSVKEDFYEIDADMMTCADTADDANVMPAGITGDTNVTAVADITVVPICSSTYSGLKTYTAGEAVSLVDSLQDECAGDRARNSRDLAIDRAHVDSESSSSTVPCVIKSDETSMSESVTVADPQKVVELSSCLEVKHITNSGSVSCHDAVEQILAVSDWSADTSLADACTDADGVGVASTAEAVNEVQETTSVLHNAAAAACINLPELQGKINVTESVVTIQTVSANDVSYQTVSILAAAGGIKEAEEFTSAIGQNAAANSDVTLTETAVLLGLPDSDVNHVDDVTHVVDTSYTTESSEADSLDFRMEKLEEDANVFSTYSWNFAVGGGCDNEHKWLPEVIPVDYDAEGYICSVVSECKNEATGTAARISNVNSICAAESMPSLADDYVNDENRYCIDSEEVTAKGNAVIAKPTEFSVIPSRLDDAENWLITVSSDAENSTDYEDTYHRDVKIAAKKMTTNDEETVASNQECATEKHQDMSFQVVSPIPVRRPNTDYEGQNMAAGAELSVNACSSAVVAEENLNATTKSSEGTVDGAMEAGHVEQKTLQHGSDASAFVVITVLCSSEETSDLRNNNSDDKSSVTVRVEPTAGDSEVCNADDGSGITPSSAIAVIPLLSTTDRSLELPVSDSETRVSSRENYVSDGSTFTLQKKPVESLFCDGHDLSFVDHSSVTDSQDFTALLSDSHEIVKNEKSCAATDRTTVSSLQTTTSDSNRYSVVAGIADTAVNQNLVKNSSKIEPDVRRFEATDGKGTGVVQQQPSLTDGGAATCQVMPCVIYSAEAHAGHNVGSLGDTALITVVGMPERPSNARQRSQDDQQRAGRFVDNTVQEVETDIATSIDACAVGESQITDQNRVMFCHDPTLLYSVEAQAALPAVDDKCSQSQISFQNEIQLCETTDSHLGHLSDTVQADDITVTDQTYTNDNTISSQDSDRHVSVLQEKEGFVEQMLKQNETKTSPACASDDSNIHMTEAANVGMVSATSLSVIQIDTKSAADKDKSGWASSAVVTDARLHKPSGHSEVLDDGTCGMAECTQGRHRMADDTVIAVHVQHDTAVASKEHCAHLPLTAMQYQNHEHEGISANQAQTRSRTCAFDKTNRVLSRFFEDVDAYKDLVSKKTTSVSNALSTDDVYLPVNDLVENTSNTSVEQLAATDVYKSAFCDLTDATSGDDNSDFHFRDSVGRDKKNIPTVGLNVNVAMPSVIKKSPGMLSATIMGEAQDLDRHADDGCAHVCAETLVNADVPVVADSATRETWRSMSGTEMMVESNQSAPLPNVGSTPGSLHSQLNIDMIAQRLDDSEGNCKPMSSQIQPQQAVSHPAPTENVRTGSKQTSGSSGGLHHSSSSGQAGRSVVFADCLPVQVKSVDCRVQNPRSSNLKKRVAKLTDTEVLGIDLEPERQCNSVESRLQQSPDVEVVMSGHSTFGLGRQTDFQYQSIGLQPVGTQQPQFTPGPEQVLRNEVTEQYPESFWHSALDIEIRPQNEDDSHKIRNEARTRKSTTKSDTVGQREVKDYVVVTQLNRDPDLLRVTDAATNRETAGRQWTLGGRSCVFNDSLETLHSVSTRNPECHRITVNRENSPHVATSSRTSQQYPASQHHVGRSQVYDLDGVNLFRCKSLENMDCADVEPEYRLVRSYSDKSIISARRSCRRHQRRRLAQPTLGNSNLSHSDQELLGSTSALFEDLLPNFKDLPFFLSVNGSDTDTDEDKLIRDEFGQVNFLRWYHDLPSVPGSGAYSSNSDRCRHEPAARMMRPDIAIETAHYDDMRTHHKDDENMFTMPFRHVTAKTDCNQPFLVQTNEYGNSMDASDNEMNDDMADRTQSMDSITYVFVGHDDNSLKTVANNRCGMKRFSSEPLSYPCEDTVKMQHCMPVHPHASGVPMESSSDNCLLSASAVCPTPIQRSLSYSGANDWMADNGGFSNDFSSDVRLGHQQMPTTPFSEFRHNETSTQTLCELRLSKSDASLETCDHSKVTVQANESLNERYAKQPVLSLSSVGRSQRAVETQTHQNHQLHQDDNGDAHQLTSGSDGSSKIVVSSLHDHKSRPAMLSHSGQKVESDTLEVAATTAAGYSVSDIGLEDAGRVDESLQSQEQLNIGACNEILLSSAHGSHQTVKNSHTTQNVTRDDISARIYSTESLSYSMDGQSLSAKPTLHLSSGRTVETQTYPEMRVIETQTSNKLETCGTQTTCWNDVGNQDQIDACLNVPLTNSGSASTPGLHATPVNRLRSECLSPALFVSDVVSSQLMMSAARSTPIMTMSHTSLKNDSRPVVGTDSSIHITDLSAITAANAAADQLRTVLSPEPGLCATNTVDMWSGCPRERSSNTRLGTNLSSSLTLSLDHGLSHKKTTQTSEGSNISVVYSLLPRGLLSSATDLAGCRRITHNSTSVASTIHTSTDLASDFHSTQTSVNNERLLAVSTTRGSLQRSATLAESVEHGSHGSIICHHGRTSDKMDVCHSVSRPSYCSSVQSMLNTLSPASNYDLEMVRTQESWGSGTSEVNDGGRSKLKADKILEKYRKKRATDAHHSVHLGDISSTSSPQYDNYAHLSQSAVHSHASSYSHINDSGIVDSQHSLSPLTRTLLGYGETSCDKSTTTEPSRRATAGWDVELERLHRERQLIIDMLAREVVPSRIQMELAEAHLSYLMGQTDALLQQVSEPLISQHRDVHGVDFRAFCRARLKASQRHIEAQIQQLETVGKEAGMKAARLAANLDSGTQRDLAADARDHHCSMDSPISHFHSATWSPSQREQFLLGIRRDIVSATTSQPVTPVHTSSRWHAKNFRRSWPNRGLLSAHSSLLNLGPDDSIDEEEPEWCPSSFTATPASSLRRLDRRRRSDVASSVNSEIDSLLKECQEARQRARVEIGRAMDAIQRTSPAWTNSPLSTQRYFTAACEILHNYGCP